MTFHLDDTNNTSVKGYLQIGRTPPMGIDKDVGSIRKGLNNIQGREEIVWHTSLPCCELLRAASDKCPM